MKALVTADITESELNRLRQRVDVIYESWRESGELIFDENELIEKLKDIDIFIFEGDDVKKRVIEETSLKIIAGCRNDLNNVDLDAATKKNIPVLYTPRRNAIAVADLTACLILSLARNLTRVDKFIHSEDFEVDDLDDWLRDYKKFEGVELFEKTIGIIGLGNIGKLVAQRLIGFGVKILISDPFVKKENAEKIGKLVELEELMSKSDFVTIHVPPIEATNNLINENMLSLMKPSAYIINTAKGSVMDYNALYKSLKDKKIAGAALDVFPMEPIDEDNEFIEFDNVIVLPHYGGNTIDVKKRYSKMIIDDVLAVLDKKIPVNIVNPEILEGAKVDVKDSLDLTDIPYYDLRKKVVDAGKIILDEEFVTGSAGNISIRAPDEEKVAITPSNVKYKEIGPSDILIINFEGKVIHGKRNPSVEKIMHLSIYKNRPDVGAVIHSHGIYSTVLSLLGLNLPPIIEEFVPYVGGEVQVAEYGEAGSDEIAENALKALGDLNAVILPNHGNICCGSHIEGAIDVLRMVERTAKIYVITKTLGGDIRELPEDVLDDEEEVYDLFKEDKKV